MERAGVSRTWSSSDCDRLVVMVGIFVCRVSADRRMLRWSVIRMGFPGASGSCTIRLCVAGCTNRASSPSFRPYPNWKHGLEGTGRDLREAFEAWTVLPTRSPCRVPTDNGGVQCPPAEFDFRCDKADTAQSPRAPPRWRSASSRSSKRKKLFPMTRKLNPEISLFALP